MKTGTREIERKTPELGVNTIIIETGRKSTGKETPNEIRNTNGLKTGDMVGLCQKVHAKRKDLSKIKVAGRPMHGQRIQTVMDGQRQIRLGLLMCPDPNGRDPNIGPMERRRPGEGLITRTQKTKSIGERFDVTSSTWKKSQEHAIVRHGKTTPVTVDSRAKRNTSL